MVYKKNSVYWVPLHI